MDNRVDSQISTVTDVWRTLLTTKLEDLAPILYFVFRIEQQIAGSRDQIKELRAFSIKSDERWLALTKEFTTNKAAYKASLKKTEPKLIDTNISSSK